MALFSRKTKDPSADKAGTKKDVAPKAVKSETTGIKADVTHVLLSPRITEKATSATANGVYVFDVAPSATKSQIIMAVKTAYNVKTRMVRVVTIRPKAVRNMRTGKSGVKKGGKKAYVYLAKGETIIIN